KSVSESDVLKTFREKRVGVSKEAIQDPVKVRNATRVLKEMLAAKGHPNATVKAAIERVSATSNAITFQINEGPRVRVAEIRFEGSKVFKSSKLREQMKYVQEAGLISRFREQDILDREKLEVANGEAISKALYENLKKYYGNQGFIQYTAEVTPTFKDNPQNANEGVADFLITIDEGKQFTLRRLEFTGNTFTRDNVLRRV